MASFNRVLLMGNLVRDPETKTLPSGTVLSEFGLAVNRHYKTSSGEEREEVTFLDCTAFGKQAEVIQRFCQKGKPLFIEGRLKQDVWDDRNGGGKRSKISVVVENFQFIGGPRDDDGNDRRPAQGETRQRQPSRTNARAGSPFEGPELDDFDPFAGQ